MRNDLASILITPSNLSATTRAAPLSPALNPVPKSQRYQLYLPLFHPDQGDHSAESPRLTAGISRPSTKTQAQSTPFSLEELKREYPRVYAAL